MPRADLLTGMVIAADRDEVGVGCERRAVGSAVGGVPCVFKALDQLLGNPRRAHVSSASGVSG